MAPIERHSRRIDGLLAKCNLSAKLAALDEIKSYANVARAGLACLGLL
jgi:hypothetical protein